MSGKPTFDSAEESNPDKLTVADRTLTTNEAGGVAYEAKTPEFGLYKVIINQLIEDTYYDTVNQTIDKIWDQFDRIADSNPEFVLQLATYARHEEGLRDIPQLLLVLAANDERITQPDNEESSLIRDYTPAIIDRTDEFNSVISYQKRGYGTPIPNGLKKGIEDALHKKYRIVSDNGEDTFRRTFIEGRDDESVSGILATVDEGYVHDEYTASKYSQRDKQVSLHDVLNLVRPKPRSDNRNQLFASITKGELSSGVTEKDHWDVSGNFDPAEVEPLREDRTWESELSQDDDRSEEEKYRARLDDMGLMARIRNLRNMLEAGISGGEIFDYDEYNMDTYDDSENKIFGPESREIVKNHHMFPFRYYQAYKACGNVGVSRSLGRHTNTSFDIGRGSVLDMISEHWLNSAIDVSAENIPDELENTYSVIDLSGSMDREVSNDSSMARAEIGCLFGAILMKRNSDVGVFGDDFANVEMNETARDTTSTLDITERLYSLSDKVGNSTNGWKSIQWAVENNAIYDRFIVFTDEQLWDSTTGGIFSQESSSSLKEQWDEYTNKVNPNAELYVVDLASYGTLSMPEGYHNVHQISGWSDNIIDYIVKSEDSDSIIEMISSIDKNQY